MGIDDSVHGAGRDVFSGGTNRLDELFRQLSHPARRHVLLELLAADDAIHYSDLNSAPGLGADGSVSLHHVHLPQLATAGYIEWDWETGTIAPGPRLASVAPAVEQLASLETYLPGPWR